MLKDKNILVIKNPVQIGHSLYIPVPREKCILNKDKTYIFKINISEVEY